MLNSSQVKNAKAKIWACIIYPESMHASIEQWPGIIQNPFCYILHDKDTDENGEIKKAHYHVMITFTNTTTCMHALNIFKELGEVNHAEAVKNEGYYYQYMTHSNEPQKHQYSPEELIHGNGYEPKIKELSPAEADKMAEAIADAIIERCISNYADAYQYARQEYGREGGKMVRTGATFFNALTRGMYLKQKQAYEEQEREAEARRASYFHEQKNKSMQA